MIQMWHLIKMSFSQLFTQNVVFFMKPTHIQVFIKKKRMHEDLIKLFLLFKVEGHSLF